MTPIHNSIPSGTIPIDIEEVENYSIILGIKELFFLAIILFFGFSGFSFCFNTIYKSGPANSIEDIIEHDLELADLSENVYTRELGSTLIQ